MYAVEREHGASVVTLKVIKITDNLKSKLVLLQSCDYRKLLRKFGFFFPVDQRANNNYANVIEVLSFPCMSYIICIRSSLNGLEIYTGVHLAESKI